MIDIIINGRKLDFTGDVTYEVSDNLFTEIGKEEAPHTYTLTIPNTENNVQVFNFIQYTFGKPTKERAAIFADGVLVCEGDLVVQGWDKKGYKVYFVEKRPITAFDKMMQDNKTLPNKINDLGRISPLISEKGGSGRWQDSGQNVGVWFYAQFDKPPYYIGRYYKPIIKLKYLIEKLLTAYGLPLDILPPNFSYFSNKYIIAQNYKNETEGDISSNIDIARSLPDITAKEFLTTCATIVGTKIINGQFVEVNEKGGENLYNLQINDIDTIKYDGAISNGRIGYKGFDHIQLGTSDKYIYKVYMEHPFALILHNPDSTKFYKDVAGVTPETEYPSIVMYNKNNMTLPTESAIDATFTGYLQAETTLPMLNDISTLSKRGCFSLYTNTKCQITAKSKINPIIFGQIKKANAVYIAGVGVCYVKKLQYNGEVCSFDLVKC